MGPRHSHQLVEVLRATLHDLRSDPGLASPEDVGHLERIMLRWIAEAEGSGKVSGSAAVPMPPSAPAAATPLSLALQLATALVADPGDDDSAKA